MERMLFSVKEICFRKKLRQCPLSRRLPASRGGIVLWESGSVFATVLVRCAIVWCSRLRHLLPPVPAHTDREDADGGDGGYSRERACASSAGAGNSACPVHAHVGPHVAKPYGPEKPQSRLFRCTPCRGTQGRKERLRLSW